MKERGLHVTISFNTFHRLGGEDQSAYFVTIDGISRIKQSLSYHTKQEAEAIVTEMARSVAQIYMAEAESRRGKSPVTMGRFGGKTKKTKKR